MSFSLGDLWEQIRVPAVCVALLIAVGIVFGPTACFEFVNYDDNVYVYDEPVVARGLTGEGITRAFRSGFCGEWAPLTMLSHMGVCQFFDLNAGAHHLVNVLIHGAAAALLFLALARMTGTFWPSAFVAALFAIHPLRVESVAWIAERKDVLSGLLFAMTLWSYERYARSSKTALRYLAVMGFFGLGLMTKSMLVTLPALLLVLDYWPLERGRTTSWGRLAIEKLPLFAMSAAASGAAIWAHHGAIIPGEKFPLSLRAGNALVSAVTYLGQMAYPVRLTVFYPLQTGGLPGWQILGAGLVLTAISTWAFLGRRKRPWALTGWLWYVGMLVPVSGIVQAGSLARADRYTYLPQIGIALMLAWGGATWCGLNRPRRGLVTGAAILGVMALMVTARNQVASWKDSEALWRHAISNTGPNALAQNSLGMALAAKGQREEALAHFREAVRLQPTAVDPHYNLGAMLLGNGDFAGAIRAFQAALALQPDHARARAGMGDALLHRGDADTAIQAYRRALQIEPRRPAFLVNLGGALAQKGLWAEAITHYQDAMTADPSAPLPVNNLAWVLATCPDSAWRDGTEAVRLAELANRLQPGDPNILDTMAAAYAQAGRFPEAVQTARGALKLAHARSHAALVAALQRELALYLAGRTYADPGPVPPESSPGSTQ